MTRTVAMQQPIRQQSHGVHSAIRFREIRDTDIPALFRIRVATDQNCLTADDLQRMNITPQGVRTMLHETYKGWLALAGREPVGFAMGDRSTGELWVIAVLPEFCGRGIGSHLLDRVEDWLAMEGCPEFWLTTDVDTTLRAYPFYRNRGWQDAGIRDGIRFMTKRSPGRDFEC